MAITVLESVDFEHIEAERDPNLLRYFLETESFDRIFRGQKMYVIGRKGTGKSTIYSAIEGTAGKNASVAGLTFDDYPWLLHNRVRDETKSIDSAHIVTWRYIILIELAKLLIAEPEPAEDGSGDRQALAEFVNAAYGTTRPSLKHLLVNLLERLRNVKTIELPKWGPSGFGMGAVHFDQGSSQEKAILDTIKTAADAMQEKVLEMLSARFYFVLFDKLDDGWDASDYFKGSMVGLLRAARDLNIEANKKGKLLRCVVFLRSDIYDDLQYNDKNKAFSDIEFLSWNANSLQQLINKRIAKSLQLKLEANAWEQVFSAEPMRQGTTSYRYIIRRTLLRPRDLIAFCQECKARAIGNAHEQIMSQDIYEAEAFYSERIYREFLDEMHKQHPFVESLFEVLRRLRFERFSFPDFEAEFKRTGIANLTASDAFKILFEYSIVGVVRIGGSGGGSTLEFKFTDPLIQPDFSREIVVHPGLKKHLKLVERRSRAAGAATDADELPLG